jgi:hypothetical protein
VFWWTGIKENLDTVVIFVIYGNNPRKLFVKIIRNRDAKINEFPLFSFPLLTYRFTRIKITQYYAPRMVDCTLLWCDVIIGNLKFML